MRGKVIVRIVFCETCRITPAYAGKSQSSIPAATFLKDHPRLCGEKIIPVNVLRGSTGSPPPMRGKVACSTVGLVPARITPAYAGKSSRPQKFTELTEDHPRLCGEKTKKITKQRYFFHQPASFSFSLQYT